MAEFKAGDVVQLKSGGPKMTISKVQTEPDGMYANCDWFEGTKPNTGYFPLLSLKYPDEPVRGAQVGSGRSGTWS